MPNEIKWAIIMFGSFLGLILGLGIIAGILAFIFGVIELLKSDGFIYSGVVGIIIGTFATLGAIFSRYPRAEPVALYRSSFA